MSLSCAQTRSRRHPGTGDGYDLPSTCATGNKPTDVAIGDLDVVVTTDGNQALVFLNAPGALIVTAAPAVAYASLACVLPALLASGALALRHRRRTDPERIGRLLSTR
jgi:hypothetical protein